MPCALPPHLPCTLRSLGGAAVPRCAFRWEEVPFVRTKSTAAGFGITAWRLGRVRAWVSGQGRASVRTAVGGGDPLHRQVEEPLEAAAVRGARHALQPNPDHSKPLKPSNLGGEVNRDG